MAQKTKNIKIAGCTQCPYVRREYVAQGDYSWVCDKKKGKVIVYKAETFSQEPHSKFPDWCPL